MRLVYVPEALHSGGVVRVRPGRRCMPRYTARGVAREEREGGPEGAE